MIPLEREGDLVARVTLALDRGDGDWRIVGVRLLDDVRLLGAIRLGEADRGRLKDLELNALGAERLELREGEIRDEERTDRETDGLDRLKERAETLDLPEDDRDRLCLVGRPHTWAVVVNIATRAIIAHHRRRFG